MANIKMDEIFGILGERAPELPQASPVMGTYCALLCHQKAGVEMPRQVIFQEKPFSHRKHAFDLKMGCTQCHSSENHKEISITQKDCSSCHNLNAAASKPRKLVKILVQSLPSKGESRMVAKKEIPIKAR